MLHGAGPCSDLPEAECCPGPVSPRQRAALAPPCAAEAWAAHREHCGAWPSRAEAAAWGGGHALPRLGGALSSTAPSTPQSSGRRAAEGDGAEPTAAAADAVDRALSGGGGCRLLRILLDGRVLGSVEVALDSSITLFDLRGMIAEDQIQGVPPEFCFLLNGGPVSEPQEKRWLAANCLPALDIAERNADGSWGLLGFFAYLFGSSGPAPASPDPASAAPAPWSPGPLPARPAPPEPPALLAAQRAALAAAARSAPRAQHADDVLSHSQRSTSSTASIPGVAAHGGRAEGTFWIPGPRRAPVSSQPQRFDLTEHDVDEEDDNFFPTAWRTAGSIPGTDGTADGALAVSRPDT